MTLKRNMHVVGMALCVCLIAYFGYHTVQGERGLLTLIRLQREVNSAKGTLTELQAEHAKLSRREELMRAQKVDPDLLDEEARKNLNYAKPGEVIILTPGDNNGSNPRP